MEAGRFGVAGASRPCRKIHGQDARPTETYYRDRAFEKCLVSELPDETCGIPSNERTCRDVFGDDTAGTHHCTGANRNPRENG